jgi:hypothetical protein
MAGYAAAIVSIFALLLVVVVWKVVLVRQQGKRRPPYIEEPSPYVSGSYAEANVATQLVPLLEPHVTFGTELTIVGNRGDYSALVAAQTSAQDVNNEKWIHALRSWLDAKAEINYLLVAANDDGRAILEPLRHQYSNFHLWQVTPEDFDNDVDKAYVKELTTFHPILLENKKKKIRAMWIENDHQPGSITAKNCEFIAPKDARTDRRFDDISNFLQHLISH